MSEISLEIPLRPRRTVGVRIPDLPDPDPRGKLTRLASPSAATLRLMRDYQTDSTRYELLWDIAGTLLPDLTPEEVERLTVETIAEVMQLVQAPIADLEARAKNGDAPLAEALKGSN